jgi:hypothetical protein
MTKEMAMRTAEMVQQATMANNNRAAATNPPGKSCPAE